MRRAAAMERAPGMEGSVAAVGGGGAAARVGQTELRGSGCGCAGGDRGRCGRRIEVDGDVAVENDVAGGLVGGGAGLGGDGAGAVGMEFGAIEDGGGVAEDIVDAAFDVGVNIILAAVVGEEGVLVAEEAAVFEDAAVAAVGYGDGLAGVAGGVLEGDVIRFEAGAVDLDGFSEEGAASDTGVERVGDDDVGGRFAEADEGDVVVVLGDDDALVVGAGDDLDEDAAGSAIGVGRGEGVVVERVDDGGEGGEVLVAGLRVRGGRVDADMDVGGVGDWHEEERGENES